MVIQSSWRDRHSTPPSPRSTCVTRVPLERGSLRSVLHAIAVSDAQRSSPSGKSCSAVGLSRRLQLPADYPMAAQMQRRYYLRVQIFAHHRASRGNTWRAADHDLLTAVRPNSSRATPSPSSSPSWGLRTSARARSKPFYTGPSRRILLAGFRRALLRRLSYHEGVVCSDFADLSAAAANERFLVTSADSPTRGIRVKACPSRVPSRRPR